jgi:hypothetical protein
VGILEGLKRTFNVAGAKITVVLEDEIYSQFDVIRGKVVVTAPDYKLAGNAISLELKEFWTETRSTGKTTTTVTVHKTRVEVALQGTIDFEPGSQHSFSFEVGLPKNCRISTSNTGWRLVVTMDIPNAIDATEGVVLEVQPAEEFLAIIEVCEENLRFQERRKSRRWNPDSRTAYFRLLPPEMLKSELDYLAFDMSQAEDGSVEGDLIFNLQEKSIADYFKAIVGKDKIRKHFHLAPSQIYARDGSVSSEDISAVIGRTLKEVMLDQRNQ